MKALHLVTVFSLASWRAGRVRSGGGELPGESLSESWA